MKRFSLLVVFALSVLSSTICAMNEQEEFVRPLRPVSGTFARAQATRAKKIWQEVVSGLDTVSQQLDRGYEMQAKGEMNKFKELVGHVINKQTELLDTLTAHANLIEKYIKPFDASKGNLNQILNGMMVLRTKLTEELEK